MPLDAGCDLHANTNHFALVDQKGKRVDYWKMAHDPKLILTALQPQRSKILGAIGDPFRFQNGRQVLKMAGLDLNAERSGKSASGTVPVITRKGKADLRYALYQAALIASIKNREFMVYYTNKLRDREKEPGIKMKMRVKLAAKLLIIGWTLMKKKEPFNPDYLNLE